MTLPTHLARRFRRGLLLAAVAAAGTLSACEDPFELNASSTNVDITFDLWALTGAPAAYPSGLLVPQATAVRLDAAGSFDLAFDIDADGRVRVFPVASVVSPIAGTREVSFLRGTGPYNTIIEAPADGWQADSVLVVNEGQSFLAKVNTQYCQYDFRQYVFAKFLVDSVIPAERRMKISARINPNCGFRSLLSGVPEY
jgi:hypothetical protein